MHHIGSKCNFLKKTPSPHHFFVLNKRGEIIQPYQIWLSQGSKSSPKRCWPTHRIAGLLPLSSLIAFCGLQDNIIWGDLGVYTLNWRWHSKIVSFKFLHMNISIIYGWPTLPGLLQLYIQFPIEIIRIFLSTWKYRWAYDVFTTVLRAFWQRSRLIWLFHTIYNLDYRRNSWFIVFFGNF